MKNNLDVIKTLNLEYFIAKRLIAAKSYKSSISSPIIKIAITAIAIGIIMMIMAVATGVGLQNKIREKVSAFNGQIIISNFEIYFLNMIIFKRDTKLLLFNPKTYFSTLLLCLMVLNYWFLQIL